jgi:hypothetical protein
VDDPRDRRRAVLRLTRVGRRANAVRRHTVESAVADALVRVPAWDRAATRRVLERLASCLESSSSRGRETGGSRPPKTRGGRGEVNATWTLRQARPRGAPRRDARGSPR